MPGRLPSPSSDFRALAKRAAQIGAVLAVLCHLVPPHYRAVCTTLATLCTGGHP